MNRQDLFGFVPAIATPFNAAGEIMEDAFAELFAFLVGRGASAVCIAGDNGESWALSPEERGRLVRLAKDLSAGRVPIIMGISAPTISGCLTYIKAARDNGADALLSMPQTYVLKATDAELMHRFDQIHRAAGLPVILYNSPRRMGFSLSVDQIGRILDGYDVIGIKESHRDFFHHTHLLNRFGNQFSVMTGPCHYIMPAFGLGAKGFIATGPEFIDTRPSDLAVISNEPPGDAHRHAHHQLTAVYELLMGTATWPASFKAALNLIGLPAGVPRDPVLAATDADIEKIKAAFGSLGIAHQ